MVWNVEVSEAQSSGESFVTTALDLQQVRDEAADVYKVANLNSLSNPLPLILAGYPSEAGNTLTLVTSPAASLGLGELTATKLTTTLDVTLPGGDILVELEADIGWTLPAAAYSVTSGSSSASSSGASSASSSAAGTSHTHTISSLTLVADASHTHNLSGAGTMTTSDSNTYDVPSATHTHKFMEYDASIPVGYAGEVIHRDGNGNAIATLDGTDTTDMSTFATGTWATGSVADSGHKHSLSGVTSAAGTSHNHTVSSSSLASDASHTHTIAHTHNIDHTHGTEPPDTGVDVKMELVVDDTVITAGYSQLHVEGFTGVEGVIQLRSTYVLRKSTSNASILSSGQHNIGLKFTITTIDFTAVSTVTAKNISIILRDAAFDERVKVFTP